MRRKLVITTLAGSLAFGCGSVDQGPDAPIRPGPPPVPSPRDVPVVGDQADASADEVGDLRAPLPTDATALAEERKGTIHAMQPVSGEGARVVALRVDDDCATEIWWLETDGRTLLHEGCLPEHFTWTVTPELVRIVVPTEDARDEEIVVRVPGV